MMFYKKKDVSKRSSLALHLFYKFTSISKQTIELDHGYCSKSSASNDLVGNRPNNTVKLMLASSSQATSTVILLLIQLFC